MSEQQHTPLPWTVAETKYPPGRGRGTWPCWTVEDANSCLVCCMPTIYAKDKETAKEIVRACNAFPAMVELLEAAKHAVLPCDEDTSGIVMKCGCDFSVGMLCEMYHLRAAIAKAEKELEE